MILYFVLILAVAAADQMLKKAALSKLGEAEVKYAVGGFVRFTLVRNPGAAFGILRSRRRFLKIFTSVLTAVLMIYLSWSILKGDSPFWILAFAFVAGGALGNLLDRLRMDYVVDYVGLNINGFPFFNLADFSIFTGAIMLLTYSYFEMGF